MAKNLKRLGVTAKILGLAGLVFAGGAVLATKPIYAQSSTTNPANTQPMEEHAQYLGKIKAEENNSPQIIATFEYKSNRKGYEGDIFEYNVKSDIEINEKDNPGVSILPTWNYKGEEMHPKFNTQMRGTIQKVIEDSKKLNEQYEQQITNLEQQVKNLEEKPLNYETNAEEIKGEEYAVVKEKRKFQKDNGLHLILGFNSDTDFDSFGGAIGLQYTPTKNIGTSVLVNFNKALDKNISSIQTPEFKGIHGEITKDETNSFSIGPSLEVQAGPLILGAGFNYWNWIEKTEEEIIKNAEVKKSSTNSISNSKIYGNIYTGLEFKFKNVGLGAIVGHDFKKGTYIGTRTTIRLNKPKREFKK